MKIRQVLADQIRSRMAKKPDLDTQTKLSKAAGVTQSTVWRVLEGEVGASVDVVESFAKAFGVPAVALLTDSDQSKLLETWGQLDRDDKEKVMSFMQVTISSRPSNMLPQQKYWMEEQPITSGLVAASNRASTRPPARVEIKNVTTTAESARKRSTTK